MREQDRWRLQESINLLPSENMASPQLRALLSSDFGHRYTLPVNAEYAGTYLENSYRGTRITTEVEESCEQVAREVFKAGHACVQPLSGHIAAMIVIASSTSKGDGLMAVPVEFGGYDGYGQAYIPDILGLTSGTLPFDQARYNLDSESASRAIARSRPKLVILGASFILFPYDMAPIAEACRKVGATLAYDGSHVLGLIAGGEFQDPLKEGANALYGSTHKSFFGPQGGLIVTDDDAMDEAVRKNLTWRLVDNVHWNRVAALGQALMEMKKFGPAYAKQVVKNSKKLAKELHGRGFPLMFSEIGFSESHQLLIDTKRAEALFKLNMNNLSVQLEKSNIIIDSVGRMGTAEITRLGIKEKHLPDLAELIMEAVEGRPIKKKVKEFRDQFDMDYRFR